MINREFLKDKQRIVIKIGTTSLTHEKTGDLNLAKIEKLARQVADLRGMGKDVVIVSSGAIGAGKQALGVKEKPQELAMKQAFAAVGQARLMMCYQRIFSEYNLTTAQVLLTKHTVLEEEARENTTNTFHALLELGTIPIVNENDTVSTYEIRFGDNDRLSAIVSALIEADLLILLSDIDGLYTDDPRKSQDAKFIPYIENVDDKLLSMGKDTSSNLGTGGMEAKLIAAKIAMDSGCDMIIANGEDFGIILRLIDGESVGSLFKGKKMDAFFLGNYID